MYSTTTLCLYIHRSSGVYRWYEDTYIAAYEDTYGATTTTLRRYVCIYTAQRYVCIYTAHPALPRPAAARTAYVSIRQHTSAYVSIRQHTSAYVSAGSTNTCSSVCSSSLAHHTSAYVSIRQHTAAYVSIREQQAAPTPAHPSARLAWLWQQERR
jgi:hypothetical protein